MSPPTAGLAPGFTQTNLIAVPEDWAYDVLLFTQRNPKPCPVLDVGDVGSRTTMLAPGADITTDLPLYRVWKDGELADETADVSGLWRDDLVAFHIGCSFTFEHPVAAAGVPLRHVEQGTNVPMFVTNRECRSAGRMSGPMVVSMRPVPEHQVALAAAISARMPAVHGGPVHIGDPAELGIADVASPRLRRSGELRARRRADVLGLRGHPAGGGDGVPVAVRDHPCARVHADHRHPGQRVPSGGSRCALI